MTRTITATSIQAYDLRVRGEPGPVGVGARPSWGPSMVGCMGSCSLRLMLVPMAPRPSSSPCWPTWASPSPSGTASGHARCPRQCGYRPHPAAPPDRPRAGPVRHLELGDLPAGPTGPRRGRLATAGGPLPRIRPLRPPSTLTPLGKYPPARPRRRDVATPEGQAGGRCLNLLAALRLRPLGMAPGSDAHRRQLRDCASSVMDNGELPRVFRTGNLRLIHAAACPFRYSSRTSCGVRYPSVE